MAKSSQASKNMVDTEVINAVGIAALTVFLVVAVTIPILVAGLWVLLAWLLISGLTTKHESRKKGAYLFLLFVLMMIVNSHFLYFLIGVTRPILLNFMEISHEKAMKIHYWFFVAANTLGTLGFIAFFFDKYLSKKRGFLKPIIKHFSVSNYWMITLSTVYFLMLAGLYKLELFALLSPMMKAFFMSDMWSAKLTVYNPSFISGYTWLGLHVLAVFASLSSGFILICLLVERRWSTSTASSTERASSHIIINEIKAKKGIVLGDIDGKELALQWKDINHHIHILGQIGAGKSVLLRNIYSRLIIEGNGLLMIDLKGEKQIKNELLSLTRLNKNTSYGLLDINKPDSSVKYNPLLRGNADELKDKFMLAFTWSEEYYRKNAEDFLLKVFKAVVVLRDQKNQLATIKDILLMLENPKFLLLFRESIPQESKEIRADLEQLYIQLTTGKDGIRDLTGLKTDLGLMVKSSIGKIVCSHQSIDLLDVILQNKVLLVSLDGQRYGETSKRLSRMLIADIRSCSGYISSEVLQEKRPKFTLMVDEFSDIISTKESGEMFANLLNRSRSSGIGCVIAHQSLGDFEDERVKNQIIDNTETLFSFVQKDEVSAEKISKMIGTEESKKVTKQTRKELFFDLKTGNGSERLTEEFLIHPNKIKNLGTGECIYFAKKPTRFGELSVRFLEQFEDKSEYSVPNLELSTSTFSAYIWPTLGPEIERKYFKEALKEKFDKKSKVNLKTSYKSGTKEL